MKVILKKTREQFEFPRGIALALLYMPNSSIEEPASTKPVHKLVWAAVRGTLSGIPEIRVHREGCRRDRSFTGPTAWKVAKFDHFGVRETPPADVVQRYKTLGARPD